MLKKLRQTLLIRIVVVKIIITREEKEWGDHWKHQLQHIQSHFLGIHIRVIYNLDIEIYIAQQGTPLTEGIKHLLNAFPYTITLAHPYSAIKFQFALTVSIWSKNLTQNNNSFVCFLVRRHGIYPQTYQIHKFRVIQIVKLEVQDLIHMLNCLQPWVKI